MWMMKTCPHLTHCLTQTCCLVRRAGNTLRFVSQLSRITLNMSQIPALGIPHLALEMGAQSERSCRDNLLTSVVLNILLDHYVKGINGTVLVFMFWSLAPKVTLFVALTSRKSHTLQIFIYWKGSLLVFSHTMNE